MPAPKKSDKLKSYKITYFEGDYFSSKGEEMKTTVILGRSEADAEETFKSIFRGGHLAVIEEVHS